MSQFAEMLKAQGLTSGPVFATGIMKGHEAARAVADAKAQETIRLMTDAVITASDKGTVALMVDRLATYYHSDYVTLNQPWIRDIPFEQYRDIKLAEKGMSLNAL
ncbi:MAG: hypothetical protein P0Y55_11930 [Candidatus Cohnella colombiensis]|uniref:Uncharacterized protein n=1 Tax=Candidatus Cohnella colombiensis TaxID=3121368 RepID=A0AA95EUJ1_9BACL|nr:MAG: hypothetical protein P0Y55_11930 [Cohnella sp.]